MNKSIRRGAITLSTLALVQAWASPPRCEAAPPKPTSPPLQAPPSSFTALDFSRYSLSHHMLHSSLYGPEKLEHYSLSISQDRRELRGELRLGSKVCGHPAFIHGGAIASVCDDAMGMLFLSSGHGSGFTANLNVNYRKPIPAGTNLAVVCRVDRVEVGGKSGSKKVFLTARIEEGGENSPSPTLYAEATSLFVVKNGVKGMWNWGGGEFLATLKGFLGNNL